MPVSLAEGAARLGLALSPQQLEIFATYYRELMAWNRRANLTAITRPDEVEERHFVDSLSVVAALPGRARFSGRMVDVGSGAGFPGLALKLALPYIRLTLVESVGKRVAFLRHLVGLLELEGVEVLHGRAEYLARRPGLRESFDVAVARAVAEMPTLAELSLPFVRVGGVFIAMKTQGASAEVDQAQEAIGILGGGTLEVHPVAVPPGGRVLVVVPKVRSTPTAYPRRPGIPAKRPLRAGPKGGDERC